MDLVCIKMKMLILVNECFLALGATNNFDTAPNDTSIASKPRLYKLIDIKGDNANTEIEDKSQETNKSVDNHAEKRIKHLSGEVSRIALAIEALIIYIAITESRIRH